MSLPKYSLKTFVGKDFEDFGKGYYQSSAEYTGVQNICQITFKQKLGKSLIFPSGLL